MHSLFLLILMTELNHSTTLRLFAAKAFIIAIACGYKWGLRACFCCKSALQTANPKQAGGEKKCFDDFFGVILDQTVSFK